MIALKTALFVLALQAIPPAVPPQQQAPKAIVSGVVVNGNGEPVPNIKVTLGKLGVNLGPFTQFVLGERPQRETTLTSETFLAMASQIEAEVAGGGLPPEELRMMQAFKAIPVDDIHEITVSPSGSMSVVYKSASPVQTDERGRFSFSVDPGSYRLSFSGAGYAKQDYGQRTGSVSGVPLTLTPGQTKTDIVMRMLPVGAVTGSIRDNAGQPAAGVPVQLFRFVYDETGKRTAQRVTNTRTNDLGEYRMYYLTPGRYYVSAGGSANSNGPEGVIFLSGGGVIVGQQNRIAQNYALSYYPGVSRESDAAAVEVPPGSDLRGIDFFVSPQLTYKVRGRVVDSQTGQPPPRVSISMVLQNLDLNGIISTGGNSNYKSADGSFEMQNVGAGAYVLSASIPRPPQNAPINFDNMSPAERNEYFRAQQAEDLLRPKASLPLTVVNSDIDGVVLSLGLNGTISGRIRSEGNATPSLDFVRVQFKNSVPTSILESGPNSRPVTADGTFRVENVRPGEYRVVISGLPPGFYLKEARLGETDVLNTPLRYGGGDASGLELVLSPNVGALDGVTEAGAQVVLIPTRSRERTELFRPVTADTAGHFTIPDITPGDYTLAAWESIEPFSFFDPNLIREAETQGKNVRVEESSNQRVNVSVIK
jgi:5-hydroxyisourate hydrolase-like protein (transthyretin family)